ncbi:translocation/assembly module TamB domain-containing protein [Thermaurantiacus sp.]
MPAGGAPGPRRRGWLLPALALPLLALGLLGAGLWVLSETRPGRAFVAERLLPRLRLDSGLGLRIDRLEGSLLRSFVATGVILTDLDGPFASAARVEVVWSPLSVLGGAWRIERLRVPEARLERRPRLNPAPPDEPLLPDIRLALGELRVDRLVVSEAVAGVAEVLAIRGRGDLGGGRLVAEVALSGDRGDDLRLLLDSEPDRDRFDASLAIRTVETGLLAALAGIDQPLVVTLSGTGGWSRWRGVLNARVRGASVATIGIALREGRVGLDGEIRPGPFLDGPAGSLLGERVRLAAEYNPEAGERGAFRVAAEGAGLRLEGRGELDRPRERLAATTATVRLERPGRLDPRLEGGPVALRLTAEGPLRRPTVGWSASAPRLALRLEGNRYGLDTVAAEGRVLWDGSPGTAFRLSAGAVSGLAGPVAALLERPVLTGRLGRAGGRLLATDLRLRTSALAASGEGVFEPASGRYRLSGAAGIPAWRIGGAGTFALETGFVVVPDARGEAVASGDAQVRVLGLDNATLRGQLGGLPRGRARWSWQAADGTLALASGELAAPRVSVRGLEGRYLLDSGRFTLRGEGRSEAFGPFALVASGTTQAPTATLRAAKPGLGVGLSDLVVEVAPAAGGFRVAARGATSGGPASLAGVLRLPDGTPLALELERAELAGLEASGRIVQTRAGPFAGPIAVRGPGLELDLILAAEGSLQRIDVAGEAAEARLPLATPVRIGAGTLRGSILLAPDGPRIEGSADARNLVRGDLDLARLAASAGLAAGVGTARIEASGRYGPRPLAAVVRLGSDREGYRLGLEGTFAGVPIRTVADAAIRVGEGRIILLPAQLAVAGGRLDVAGRLDGASALQLRLSDVSLALLGVVGIEAAPEGRLSGAIDLALPPGGGFPDARLQLRVRGFTPPGLVGALPRIDVDLEGRSTPSGAELGARLEGSRGSTGRLLVRLAPGPGDTLVARALAGALSGGVRYFGPAETPWSFLGLPDQALSGPIGLAADFGGTLGSPDLSGGFRGEGLLYRHLLFGTRVSGIEVQGVFDGGDIRVVRLDGASNGGRLSGSGRVRLAAEGAGEVDLRIALDRARLADSPSTRATVSGNVALRGNLRDLVLSGDLEIAEGEIRLGRLSTAAAPVTDVRVRRQGARAPSLVAAAPTRLRYDLLVRAPNSVRIEGLGLDSFWGGRFGLGGDLLAPRLSGEATLSRGTFDFAGRSFEISRGRVGFAGDPLDSSVLIEASATSDGFTAGVRIAGTARRPEISLTSSPALPEDEVLSRLLFGSSIADLSAPEAIQLAAAVAGLRGGASSLDPIGRLRRASGLDRLRLTGADAETGMGAGIALGERIGRNLYVEVATDTSGNALTSLELILTRVLSLLVQVNTLGDAGVSLRYARDY